jgi:hypothetical protein
MPTYNVAHIREQGQQMIIIPVDRSFGRKSNTAQNEIRNALQLCSQSAGLAGTVVVVWEAGSGRMGFLGPVQWQSFFSHLTLQEVAANFNRKLTCG